MITLDDALHAPYSISLMFDFLLPFTTYCCTALHNDTVDSFNSLTIYSTFASSRGASQRMTAIFSRLWQRELNAAIPDDFIGNT